MNIFHQRFSTGQVCHAANLPNATLQSWLKRNLVVGHRQIEGGGSPGVHRQFSFFNVMELSIAKALTDMGLSASVALKAGQKFAHAASGPIGRQPGRIPSVPFDSRKGWLTLLCVAGERVTEYRMTKPENGLDAEVSARVGHPGGIMVLELSRVFERAVRVLGYDHMDVLAEAYD